MTRIPRRAPRLAPLVSSVLATVTAALVAVLVAAPAVLADIPPSPARDTSAVDGAHLDGQGPDLRDELRRVVGEARDRVFPALVSINVSTVAYQGGKEWKGQAVGSGAIISAEGHVVTNQHVTQGGSKFVCTLSDKRQVSATLVGEDPLTDLAVLRLDVEALGNGPLPIAHFGDSDALEIGDYVMAMGSPFSLSRSVSLGIVSNTERVFAGGFGSDDLEEMELDSGQRTGLFTRWIQHDAVISPGNSGGPLVNLAGEVVGVNELGGGTLSFAIPSNLAARVTRLLIEDGELVRSWLGLSFRPLRGTGLEEGVLVASVDVEGPAAAAGIEAGDVLLGIDGESLTVRFLEEVPLLLDRLANLEVGRVVSMALRRGDAPLSVDVTTVKLEKDIGDETSFHAWGLTAQEITPRMAKGLRLAGTSGALVTGVRLGGPAAQAEPSLAAGDVLRSIADRRIGDLDDFIAAYGELTGPDGTAAPLVVEVERRGNSLLSLLRPRPDDVDDPPRELPKAWIGVATQPLLPGIAEHLGLGEGRGFRVTRVYPGSEAEGAGLLVGDVLVGFDGEPLAPNGLSDSALFERRVRGEEIGAQVTLRVARNGEELDLPVTLERTRLKRAEARRHTDRDFELSVRELTFFDRDENRWDPEVRGVVVENVEAGGWAGLGGLRPNDLVMRLDGEEILGLKSFRRVLRDLKQRQPKRVEVLILRETRNRHQFLEPDWTPADEE